MVQTHSRQHDHQEQLETKPKASRDHSRSPVVGAEAIELIEVWIVERLCQRTKLVEGPADAVATAEVITITGNARMATTLATTRQRTERRAEDTDQAARPGLPTA